VPAHFLHEISDEIKIKMVGVLKAWILLFTK